MTREEFLDNKVEEDFRRMTKERAIDLCHAIDQYLCAGNPIWDTAEIHDAMSMAIEALSDKAQLSEQGTTFDVVRRQSVIDAVTKYCTQYDLRDLLADIEVLPSADRTGKWIPCSERLPEEPGVYWVTYKLDHLIEVDDDYYDGSDFMGCGNNVLAWYAVPTEPWKGEQDETNRCAQDCRQSMRGNILQ